MAYWPTVLASGLSGLWDAVVAKLDQLNIFMEGGEPTSAGDHGEGVAPAEEGQLVRRQSLRSSDITGIAGPIGIGSDSTITTTRLMSSCSYWLVDSHSVA